MHALPSACRCGALQGQAVLHRGGSPRPAAAAARQLCGIHTEWQPAGGTGCTRPGGACLRSSSTVAVAAPMQLCHAHAPLRHPAHGLSSPPVPPGQGKAYEGLQEGTYYPALSLFTDRRQQQTAAAVMVNFGDAPFAFAPPRIEGCPPPRPVCELPGPRPQPVQQEAAAAGQQQHAQVQREAAAAGQRQQQQLAPPGGDCLAATTAATDVVQIV